MQTKTLLLASLVLATPACAVSVEDMDDAQADALELRAAAQLGTKVFLSTDTFVVRRYEADGRGGHATYDVEVRYQVRFVPAGTKGSDYLYDGRGAMEVEAIIETVDVADPSNVLGSDFTYYAKRTGKSSFRLFDCDSTRRCADDAPTAKITAFRSGGREKLRLSGLFTRVEAGTDGIALTGNTSRSIELERVR